MPLLILGAILQISLAVHCVKTGRGSSWLGIIIFVPVIGGLVYFLTQVLPELGSNRRVRSAASSLRRSLDPHRALRERKLELQRSDNTENRMQLGNECMEVGFHSEAEKLYASCLKGINETEPGAMLGLAKALFEQNKFAEARATLEDLIAANPSFRSEDGHLLYARTLEDLDPHLAIAEYETLAPEFTGEEGRIRYAELLARSGDHEKALKVLEEIAERVRLAPTHYQRSQSVWLNRATTLKRTLEAPRG